MTDIPDIKAALLDRRYPYDFMRDLQGAHGRQETAPRARTLDALLRTEQGSQALYALIVAGTRKMLDAVTALPGGDPGQVSPRLAKMLNDDDQLNLLARDLSLMLH
jgi:hypothetical protein